MHAHTIHKNKLGRSFKNTDIWKVKVTVYLHSHMLSSSSGSITSDHFYLNSWVIPDGLKNIFIPLLIDLLTFSQFSSVAQSCPTLCNPMNCSTPGSLSVTNSRSSLKLMCIESVMPSSHLIVCRPVSSCSQPLPASGPFTMSQLFAWGGQSTGVSALASFLPKKPHGWSSEWIGCISLQSKGLSRVFSNTTVQKHQFFGAQPSSQFNSHIHT